MEILNTDAEGRLVLGDALWYARAARRHAPGRRRDAHGRLRRGARQDDQAGCSDGRRRWVEQVRAGERARRRPLLADAGLRRLQGTAEERDRRLHQYRGPRRRRHHRRALHQGVRRRSAVGPHGHRRHRVGRRDKALSAEGRHRRWRSHARRARARRGRAWSKLDQAPDPCACSSSRTRSLSTSPRQPKPTRDISIDVVVGMFAMAGVFLLVAARRQRTGGRRDDPLQALARRVGRSDAVPAHPH